MAVIFIPEYPIHACDIAITYSYIQHHLQAATIGGGLE